jgi:DNA-binding GntR family transcriptional regulator
MDWQGKGYMSKQRAADEAYDLIENMIATLKLEPGSLIVEGELMQKTGLGRTPVREALMRLTSHGLVVSLPRRGLRVSDIELAEHLTLIETRRALDILIAESVARRASPIQREAIVFYAGEMSKAADNNDLHGYMQADLALDRIMHQACRNPSAVNAVVPLVIQCRRVWYAFQHEGDPRAGADAHAILAEGIAKADPALAAKGANAVMDYLEKFARKIIDS